MRQKDERNVVYATMEDAEMDGHIYLCKEDLISKALAKYPYMTSAGIMRGATVLIKEKGLTEKDGRYALAGTVRAENELAKYCANCLTNNRPLETIDVAERLPAVVEKQKITLSESQRAAVVGSLSHRLSIITGGPGSGKTTLLRSICGVFGAETLTDILLLAPTGKAARRLAKQAHGAAHTIHSVLHSSRGKPYLDGEGCFRAKLIIVDEVSMVETAIMRDILRALRDKSRLILVGDPAQLPSVGPGTVFADMLACGFPVFELTDNFRLMEKSNALAENIQRIRVKDAELTYDESFHMISAKTAGEAESMMIELYVGLQLDGKSVQMLSPSGKTRRCSVNVLNTLAQGLVNPACTGTLEVPIGNQVYRVGDRIVQTQNNKYAMNGDVGTVVAIQSDGSLTMEINFDADGRTVEYKVEQIRRDHLLDHAYALTVHKAQGSEYDYVILPMVPEQMFMWYNNMIYTAASRAKKAVILVGQEWVMKRAIQRKMPVRNTELLKKILMLSHQNVA